MSLIMEVMQSIANPIGKLALWIEETYQVDRTETTAKWRELTGMNITDIKEVDEVGVMVETKKNKLKIPKTKDVCRHIFLSGQKTGEQCTTKPKGGAAFCSAHKPKDSVKSTTTKKQQKQQKEVKQVDINPEFESSDEEEKEKPSVKKVSKKKNTTVKKVSKKPKKTSGDTDLEESDIDKVVKKPKKTSGDTDLEESDIDDLLESQTVVKPLLKKKSSAKTKVSKKKQDEYNTEEEHVDKELNLSDEE